MLVGISTEDFEVFKIRPTNADRDDCQKVMESADRADALKAYGVRSDANSVGSNIPDAISFFMMPLTIGLVRLTARIRAKKIPALYCAIRDNVRLVVIDLDEKDDAQLIFETLNARGTPLLFMSCVAGHIGVRG